jgi:hypothetical protein
MNLVRENGKLRVYESHGYEVKIFDGGSITIQGEDEFIKMDHNASNMKKLHQFFELMDPANKEDQSSKKSFFIHANIAAHPYFDEIKFLKYETIDGKIILDTSVKDQKIGRDSKGTVFLPIPKKNSEVKFERNSRYEMTEFDGQYITLEKIEDITIRNFFKSYETPLINVY